MRRGWLVLCVGACGVSGRNGNPGNGGAGGSGGVDDIPKVAVSTGGRDQLDVVLAQIGLDKNVGFDCYENRRSATSTLTTPCGAQLAARPQQLTDLLTSATKLAQYQLVFISCST